LSSERLRKNIENRGVSVMKNIEKIGVAVLTSHTVRDIMKFSRGAVMCDG
jgi:hypothetical protein